MVPALLDQCFNAPEGRFHVDAIDSDAEHSRLVHRSLM
jgi:hypothetical protein